MLETLPLTDWNGPYEPAVKARAVAGLEAGAVLFFPGLTFRFEDSEKQFLDARVSDGKAKNISLDPDTGKIQATSLQGDQARRLSALMTRFANQARPVEVKGRGYSKISDDRLLHIDAFPSRPMRAGRRILRFFANVAPSSPRHWLVGEPFEPFARSFLPRVGPHLPGKSWLYEKLGVTRGRRSLYDELMLSLHDAAKLNDDFQKTSPRDAVDFPAQSCWLVFTDQVLHAALGGEFALEQTFHLDVAEMAEPARAPIRVLERLSGRTLA